MLRGTRKGTQNLCVGVEGFSVFGELECGICHVLTELWQEDRCKSIISNCLFVVDLTWKKWEEAPSWRRCSAQPMTWLGGRIEVCLQSCQEYWLRGIEPTLPNHPNIQLGQHPKAHRAIPLTSDAKEPLCHNVARRRGQQPIWVLR